MVDLGAHFAEYVTTAKSQPTQPVTNLAPHVDGGQGGSGHSNVTATDTERACLNVSAAIVLTALALLWLLGGLAFRSARL